MISFSYQRNYEVYPIHITILKAHSITFYREMKEYTFRLTQIMHRRKLYDTLGTNQYFTVSLVIKNSWSNRDSVARVIKPRTSAELNIYRIYNNAWTSSESIFLNQKYVQQLWVRQCNNGIKLLVDS